MEIAVESTNGSLPIKPVHVTITENDVQFYRRNGYLLVKSLFNEKEMEFWVQHFLSMHAKKEIPGCFAVESEEEANGDLLRMYPRMMHPHRVDDIAKRLLLEPRVAEVLRRIMGEEPLAIQSMMYFKPPGARGQALHQDNYYVKAEPGTTVAAWLALDDADQSNGGLVIVPGTQDLDIKCPVDSDPKISFSREYVAPPVGKLPEPLNLKRGDALFFNGSILHGSPPNYSKDKFRKAFIGHYCQASAEKIGDFYHPVLDMDGRVVSMEVNYDSGPCGTERSIIYVPEQRI